MVNSNLRPYSAHLVFTTHWDREWVQSFEQYRFRLVNLIDRLLDILEREPEIKFVFDGQTIVLEDYLEIRPEQRTRLREYAQAGRIVFGPWYVLADQFLECAEATVRNLQIGFAQSQDFGGPMLHGYVPDSFGSIATLPLILRGFGIHSANFGRGMRHMDGPRSVLFNWRTKDGSEVLALNRGYGNAINFTYPTLWENIAEHLPTVETAKQAAEEIVNSEKLDYPVNHVYLSTGIDHMEMRAGMSAIVTALNEMSTEIAYKISDPYTYFQEVREAISKSQTIPIPTVEGEMRGHADAPMDLQGVLSTNGKIKRANRQCETLLAGVLEPLSVLAYDRTKCDVSHHLRYAWKLLLKNHPHDSLCACSRDAVIEDINSRFRGVLELADMVRENLMRDVLGTYATQDQSPGIFVVNTMPFRGIWPLEFKTSIPMRLRHDEYALVDQSGNTVGQARPIAVKNIDLESYYATTNDLPLLLSKNSSDDRRPEDCYTVLAVTGVGDFGQSSGLHEFTLVPTATSRTNRFAELTSTDTSIRNSKIEVRIEPNGTLTLIDLVRKSSFPNLGWFEDTADLGDTYDYRPLLGDRPLTTLGTDIQWAIKTSDPYKFELEVTSVLEIPICSTEVGRSEQTHRHEMISTYSIYPECDVVFVRTQFVNQSDNHRLRVGFALNSCPKIFSGGHFAVNERDWVKSGEPFPCRPMVDFIHLDDGETNCLALLTKGLYEFEPRIHEDGGEITITLARSVDSIGPAAGANYQVEHARELGLQCVEYALCPGGTLAETMHKASAYLHPIVAGGTRSITETPPTNRSSTEFVTFSHNQVVFSALKRAQDGSGVILRFYNPLPVSGTIELRLATAYRSGERVNLAEQPLYDVCVPITDTNGNFGVAYTPYEVVTLKFRD